MACHLPPSQRDILVRLWRRYIYGVTGYVEFPHQADWRLATEGMQLTDIVLDDREEPPPSFTFDPRNDYTLAPEAVKVMVPCLPWERGAFAVGETGNFAKYEWRAAVPRPGGPAHKASDMSSFKGGKSKSAGMWATGFSCLPGGTVELIGNEYINSEHEFTYLTEALLSGKRAPVKKYKHLYNDVKAGRMFLELENGMSYEAKSWSNKGSLRGGQITAYLYNEAYQLPGLEVYTGQSQNLRVEKGFAGFTTTPDKPWVKILHTMGHGRNPDWHCVCGNTAYINPYAFDLNGFMDDLPDWDTLKENAPELMELAESSGRQPGALMSREKFLISWLGQLGGFVGRVYSFKRQSIVFTPTTHPSLWKSLAGKEWVAQQRQLDALIENRNVGR